jgi:hypothetical protein
VSDLDALLAAQASGGKTTVSTDALDSLLASRANAPATPATPAAVSVGQTVNADLNSIPRQVGLTARYGLEGLANTAQIATEPIRAITDRLFGQTGKTAPLGVMATRAADWMGLPAPATPNERVVGDATRLVAGAGGLGGAARAASSLPGLAGQAGEFLSANMPQQLSSAAGAGLLGGASREAGGGPVTQGVASLIGGVAGGTVPGAVGSVVNAGRNLVSKINPQPVDQQIQLLLQRANVDWSALPTAAQNSLRRDLTDALNTGQGLNSDAVRRLADFRAVGATPTRGAITQDPVQITREMNLAKTAANTKDAQLHGLPLIQNQNNTTLIRNLNDAGATQGDQYLAGQAAIGGIQGRDASMQAGVNGLYDRVRGMAGGDIPLDRKPFIDSIYGALQKENRMAFFPKELGDTLNSISSGNTPFTPQTVDMLKTMMATASRSANDGNVRAAINVARNALDQTPVNLPPLGPGLMSGAQVGALNGATNQAQDVMGAMNEARRAAAQRFSWQESARPIEAALGGAQPDAFVQQHVIRGTLADAQAVAQNAPVEPVKNAILEHLKSRALNGAADEVGKLSQSAYNKALDAIGDRKLALFFSPQELAQLRSVGRVASYVQVQPIGSAVNNSNSGAMLIGKGYDALKALAAKIPGGQSLLLNPLSNIEMSIQNRQAQNVVPGLLTPPVQRPPFSRGLLLPAAAVGGLLAAP